MESKPWVFVAEDDENWPHLTRNPEEYMHQEGDVFFKHDWGPTNDHGVVMVDALNVHEATGLTPSQLQARVAELEAAVFDLHFTACNDDDHDINSKTASALLALYHKVRRNA